jgi:hypothetical protein
MQTKNDRSKPETAAEQETSGGRRRPSPCSPSSDTPETDLLEFEVLDDCECGINVVSSALARKLEREREEARFTAAYWRDIAAGKFAQAAVLPWEFRSAESIRGSERKSQ